MDYIDLFDSVRKRPGMYLRGTSYDEAAAFVLGCDAGNDWALLAGFREWLIVRLDGYNNLAWPALVLQAAFPGEADPAAALDLPGGHERAVATLFDQVTSFLVERRKPDALRAIFQAYEAWVQKQPWSKKKPRRP